MVLSLRLSNNKHYTNIKNIFLNTIFFISRALKKSEKNSGKSERKSANTFIAGLTVAVSTAIMISAVSISDGFKREIREKATGFSGEIMINSTALDMSGSGYPVPISRGFSDSISALTGVRSVNPFCYKPGIIKSDTNIQGIILKGVGKGYDWSFFGSSLVSGKLPEYNDTLISDKILVSARLSGFMSKKTGDTLLIYFVDNSVRARRFIISGVYDAQLEEIDKSMVIGDISMARNLNGWDTTLVSGLEVRLSSYNDIPQIRDSIENLIITNSNEEINMNISTINDIYPNLFDWLRLLDFNVLVVLVLMTIVAGFTMLSGILIIIFEKIPVIGTLKALGMKNGDIHKTFLAAASILIIKGIVIGNLFALGILSIQKYFKVISLNPVNYFVKWIPVSIDLLKIVAIDLASFALIILFLYIPLYFIAAVNPSESIKVK